MLNIRQWYYILRRDSKFLLACVLLSPVWMKRCSHNNLPIITLKFIGLVSKNYWCHLYTILKKVFSGALSHGWAWFPCRKCCHTWPTLGKHSICNTNHKLVKVFTITSPLTTVLNKKFSLPLYHALYFISFIASALLSSHSPLNCEITHVDQCPCQRQLCHLNCAKGRVSTNIQYRGPEEKTKKHVTLIWKLQK